MAGGRTTALRTDEGLWRQIVAEVTAEDKGGKAGQWSARKAQIAVARYKQAGGGYVGPKSPDNSLAKWTREEWRTKSGAPSLQTGERYLPSAAIEALTDEEYAETSRAKRRGMKRGQQFVPQPIEIAAKVAPYRKPASRARNACLTSDPLLCKIPVLNKPERQNMARQYRRNNPSMRGPLWGEWADGLTQETEQRITEGPYRGMTQEQARQAAQERSMAEYAAQQQARQQEADRQAAYAEQQRAFARQQELGKQAAIAEAYRLAESRAIGKHQGQVARQSIAAAAQPRSAAYAAPQRVSAQGVSFAQRAPMNLPKVGMKGRNRNPATLTNADFHSVNIGGHQCVVCGAGATDRKGQHKYLVAVFHSDDGGADYEVQAVTQQALKSMLGSLRPLKVPRGFESAFRRFKQQCEALVNGPVARASNPGHESGFWDQYGESAYSDRHGILKKVLKGEWKPVSRTEIMREVRDSRGYVDENRVRRLLNAYRSKVKSLADRCMRAEHSGQPFPVLEAKYEAAKLDLEDVENISQELSEGRTRNPRVHHGADFDDLAGGTVVMRPVRKGPAVRRDREDIVAELVSIGAKRNRSQKRAHSERSRSRIR